jgi:hypothetical protein
MEQGGKLVQLLGSSGCVDLHAAIIFVSYPAAQSQTGSGLLDEPAESDALYATGNKPSAGLCRHVSSCIGPSALIAFENGFNSCPQGLDSKGLRYQPESLFNHVPLHDLTIVVTGHEQHPEIRLQRQQAIDQHRSTDARHDDVRQNQIGPPRHSAERLNGKIGTRSHRNFVAMFRENRLNQMENIGLVINDKYRARNGL